MAISTGQMTVGTAVVQIDGSSANPFTITVHNESATNNLRLGGSDLMDANGLELHSHSYLTFNFMPGDTLFAVSSVGTHDISWMKIS